MTTADAIRSMNDEELAEFMYGMIVFSFEYMVKEFNKSGIDKLVEVLRSEVEL